MFRHFFKFSNRMAAVTGAFGLAGMMAYNGYNAKKEFLYCNQKNHDPFLRSKKNAKIDRPQIRFHEEEELVLFSGNANKPLAEEVSVKLGQKLGKIQVGRFMDGEVNIQVFENIRARDIYIIQPTCPPVNDNLMELFFLISTMRRASAKRITAVIPYYGYARQDRKMSSRVPISAADIARLLETIGVDRVIAIDLHCGQIQGFFGPRVPVDNLEAGIVAMEYFVDNAQNIGIEDMNNCVIVSPDAGGVYRARKFQEGIRARGYKDIGLAMIIKQRLGAGKIEKMDLVGSVEGKDCIIVDDIIDTAGTLCEAGQNLLKQGAKNVYAFATHGLFSGRAEEKIKNSKFNKIIVTNTIPLKKDFAQDKIIQLSVAILIAEVIRRIHQKESLSELFTQN